jgi:hypothetical protein
MKSGCRGDSGRIIDRSVTELARRHWGNAFDRVAIAVSNIGRGGVLWLAADAALQARARRRPLPRRGVVRAVALSYGSSIMLARLLARPRPCQRDGLALVECPDGPGLPSDQTAAAFAGAYAIARLHPRLGPPLYAAAVAIALARIYCGVHHLTDTVAGAALGFATSTATAGRQGSAGGSSGA